MQIRWLLLVFVGFLLGLWSHRPLPNLFLLGRDLFRKVIDGFTELIGAVVSHVQWIWPGMARITSVDDWAKIINELLILLLFLFLISLIVVSLYLLRPLRRDRETVVEFMDLQLYNDTTPGSGEDQSVIEKRLQSQNRAITELFAAKLRSILSVHDLAYQYCRIHFRNQEIYSSKTCADMTSVWSQVEIKSLFFEEPNRLAIGSSPFNDDLGQITSKVGPVEASFPLFGLIQIVHSRNKDNIRIMGSVQNLGNCPCVVSQLTVGKQSWAWEIDASKIPANTRDISDISPNKEIDPKKVLVPDLLQELAYHATNRIIGQTSQLIDVLSGGHFEKYSKLLEAFLRFIQADSFKVEKVASIYPGERQQQKRQKPQEEEELKRLEGESEKSFQQLTHALGDFLACEPTDLRSYYMLYIVGIIAIGRQRFGLAREYLTTAKAIEPSVIATVLRAGVSLKKLKWNQGLLQGFPSLLDSFGKVSRSDRIRAVELARGLANVNAALGFTLEQSLQSEQNTDLLTTRLILEDAASAYERAFEYKSDDPLFLSNQAEVKLRLSDALQPKDSYLDLRLRLRTEAQRLLEKACRIGRCDHQKFAWLRMGHYKLRRGDLIQAASFYQRAWDADPSFLVAARNLATTYAMRGDNDRAIEICDKALQQVGVNRSPNLTTQQIHAWIHNSRGWAYLRKAIHIRKSEVKSPLQLADARTWLQLAKNNFESAIRLMDMRSDKKSLEQKTIPTLNLLFTSWEESLLIDGILDDNIINNLKNSLVAVQDGGGFAKLYMSILPPNQKEFGLLLEKQWINHSYVPSEYLGLIADLQMLNDYVMIRKDVAPSSEIADLDIVTENIANALEYFNQNLPSCFLGLHYLWSGHPERAVHCWRQRLEKLAKPPGEICANSASLNVSEVSEISSAALNMELWSYLYQGLVDLFARVPLLERTTFVSQSEYQVWLAISKDSVVESSADFFFSARLLDVFQSDFHWCFSPFRRKDQPLQLFKLALLLEHSSPTRQYALDLLAEAREIGDILMYRCPEGIYKNKPAHQTLLRFLPCMPKRKKSSSKSRAAQSRAAQSVASADPWITPEPVLWPDDRAILELFRPVIRCHSFAVKYNMLNSVERALGDLCARISRRLVCVWRGLVYWFGVVFSC